MAVSVPDTNTYGLTDVVAAVEDHAGGIADTLEDSFNNANEFYFDGNYHNDTYAVSDSQKRFRNYGPHNDPDSGDHPITVPDAFSPNGDGVHDFFEVFNLEFYPNHRGAIYAPVGGCSCGGSGFSEGQLIYERTNNYDSQPWDGKYAGVDCEEGNYTFILEINGETHTAKTIFLAR